MERKLSEKISQTGMGHHAKYTSIAEQYLILYE